MESLNEIDVIRTKRKERSGKKRFSYDTPMAQPKVYAVYAGNGFDRFVCVGTANEVADRLGVKRDAIYCHLCKQKRGKKVRYLIFEVDMDESEQE